MRISAVFRYRKGQLILPVSKAQATIIAQAKGLRVPADLNGYGVFFELEV